MPMLALAQSKMCNKSDQRLDVLLNYKQNCFKSSLDTTTTLQRVGCTCLASEPVQVAYFKQG